MTMKRKNYGSTRTGSKQSLERVSARKQYNREARKFVIPLLEAQLVSALGGFEMFEIVKQPNGRSKHVRVDPKDYLLVLNQLAGQRSGMVDMDGEERFITIFDVKPDPRSAESVLTRAIGKPDSEAGEDYRDGIAESCVALIEKHPSEKPESIIRYVVTQMERDYSLEVDYKDIKSRVMAQIQTQTTDIDTEQ